MGRESCPIAASECGRDAPARWAVEQSLHARDGFVDVARDEGSIEATVERLRRAVDCGEAVVEQPPPRSQFVLVRGDERGVLWRSCSRLTEAALRQREALGNASEIAAERNEGVDDPIGLCPLLLRERRSHVLALAHGAKRTAS